MDAKRRIVKMKNQVESIYTKANRFAMITKKFIMDGNIVRALNEYSKQVNSGGI